MSSSAEQLGGSPLARDVPAAADLAVDSDWRRHVAPADTHDLAVVVLDGAVRGTTPALLPERDSLSDLSRDQEFTAVGYGAYEVTNSPGGHRYLYVPVGVRRAALTTDGTGAPAPG